MGLKKTNKKARKNFLKRHRITIILICFLFLSLSITIIKQEIKLNSLLKEENNVINKLEELKKESSDLQQKIEESEGLDFIEKTAREKLKMVKKNEIIYKIQEKQ